MMILFGLTAGMNDMRQRTLSFLLYVVKFTNMAYVSWPNVASKAEVDGKYDKTGGTVSGLMRITGGIIDEKVQAFDVYQGFSKTGDTVPPSTVNSISHVVVATTLGFVIPISLEYIAPVGIVDYRMSIEFEGVGGTANVTVSLVRSAELSPRKLVDETLTANHILRETVQVGNGAKVQFSRQVMRSFATNDANVPEWYYVLIESANHDVKITSRTTAIIHGYPSPSP